jgi:hypothetical protein
VCESRARDRPIGSPARIVASRRAIDLMGSNIARTRGNRPRGDLYRASRRARASDVARQVATRDTRIGSRARATVDRRRANEDDEPRDRDRTRRAKDARGDDDDADVAGDAGNRCG